MNLSSSKIHISLSNQYVEYYEEKNLQDPLNSSIKKNDVKFSSEEEESTTVGYARDDIFTGRCTDHNAYIEKNEKCEYPNANADEYHFENEKKNNTTKELSPNHVGHSEIQKEHTKETMPKLALPHSSCGGIELRERKSVHGKVCRSKRMLYGKNHKIKGKISQKLGLNILKTIHSRKSSTYCFISKALKRYLKVRIRMLQKKNHKCVSKENIASRVVIPKRAVPLCVREEEEESDKKKIKEVFLESVKWSAEEDMDRNKKTNTNGKIAKEGNKDLRQLPNKPHMNNYAPTNNHLHNICTDEKNMKMKKGIKQILLLAPKACIKNRGFFICSKMITKEKIRKEEEKKKKKKKRHECKPINLKSKDTMNQYSTQKTRKNTDYIRDIQTNFIQNSSFMHTKKCESLINQMDEKNREEKGINVPTIEGGIWRYLEDSSKKIKVTDVNCGINRAYMTTLLRKRRKEKNTIVHGISNSDDYNHSISRQRRYDELISDGKQIEKKNPNESKSNRNTRNVVETILTNRIMNNDVCRGNENYKIYEFSQKMKRHNEEHNKEEDINDTVLIAKCNERCSKDKKRERDNVGSTLFTNGITSHNDGKMMHQKKVNEKEENIDTVIKKQGKNILNCDKYIHIEENEMKEEVIQRDGGNERWKRRKKKNDAAASAATTEIVRKSQLNLNEYLILKEIKTIQSKEVVQLNLDSSFFVSKGAGLYNYGQNICFFNSIIQTIVRIPYICKDLMNKLHSLNCEKKKIHVFCFYCLFEQFACNIISKKSGIKNMLIPYIKKYICNSYIVGYQEDVHEYLRYFLCSLEKSSFSASIYIQKMFTGVTKNITICTKCNNVSLKYEQYYELSLDISSSNNLEEALKKHLSKEVLMGDNGYYCEKCRKKKKATKQCVINKLPRVLTIQIKRFFMNSKFHIVKNHKHISYPLQLDMKTYVNNCDLFQNDFNNNVISLYEKTNSNSSFHQNAALTREQPFARTSHGTKGRRDNLTVEQNGGQYDARSDIQLDMQSSGKSNVECWKSRRLKNQEKIRWNNTYVLKQVEHIFSELKREVCKKKIKKELSSKELRNLFMEKKKKIIKELKKIKFSKFYNDILLSISKDMETLYYYIKTNYNRKNFSLNSVLFNFNVEHYHREDIHESCLESCTFHDKQETKKRKNSEQNICVSYQEEERKYGENCPKGCSKKCQLDCSKMCQLDSSKKCQLDCPQNDFKSCPQKRASYFAYELTGLIKHIGSGTEYGHYVALTKSNNNIYLLCDDNNISYINKKDVLNCVKNAYVFIYTCIHPEFIDFYNKYVDVLEKKKFNINLPVFERRVEFKERITMPKQKFISRSMYI
ncbi:hypothetical protein, conserved [Plasmodium gonderi]|uniref:ubiquitinyl hydrolase 1 n=1 Tax=Plasmodium gonderi TaxID=77519 RepID=A0A1Y1JKL8_PLAGO|nr:hypothetical protein, conserved [Plasmodium gonderi]GAW83069.1 hypothetical protein, conserved [Plasmodium gonderi]